MVYTKPYTKVLICSTGSTPHAYDDHLSQSKKGLLDYYNYIVDLDGTWIEGKEWKPGDTIRVAYVGGIKPDNHSPRPEVKDTRTENQSFSLMFNLALLVIDNRINPNRISVLDKREKVSALERLKGKEIEHGGLTGFTFEEFKEELENYFGLFGLLENEDFDDPNPTGYLGLN